MTEFRAWPKTPRLNKGMVVTEKIDGTNACVNIQPCIPTVEDIPPSVIVIRPNVPDMIVTAQSRNRMICPEDDNYGFAAWVFDNATALVETLGTGYHYGEWWGSGINRGYGCANGRRYFSLFNTDKWSGVDFSAVPNLGVVPVLYEGEFDTQMADHLLTELIDGGSYAVPGYMNPEGVCVFHTAARQVFKLLPDPLPKSLAKSDVVAVA